MDTITTAAKPAPPASAEKAAAGAAPIDKYEQAKIEAKWQKKWEKVQLYRSVIDPDRQKFYALTMLPYPSGNLHIGHWYAMTPSDARAPNRAEPPKCDQDNHGGNETRKRQNDQGDRLGRSEDGRCNQRHHRRRNECFPYRCAHNVMWLAAAQRCTSLAPRQ